MIRTVESAPHASAPVLAAYSYCEVVTGQQARNFAYGIRLLPTPKRRAMSALYAFSRRVDDIGDGVLAPEVKAKRLEETRALLARIRDRSVDEDDTDPVAVALRHTADHFPVPLDGLDDALLASPLRLSTMGRGLDGDPAYFLAAAAAGRLAGGLLT